MHSLKQKKPNILHKKSIFILLSSLVFIAIFFAYSNHFSNSFHFDDSHTIKTNSAIQEINIVHFFKDATTFSSLSTNQSYRPFTTLENAIDYKLAGGLQTKAFHIHIFITFLIVCLLIGVFVKKLLDKFKFSNYNQYWGLLCTAIFGLLCANAETVNYIIQRAEITSGLFVMAGLVAFIHGGFWRSKFIYLVFPLIGFFAKEMAFVFAPVLLLYLLLFEEQVDLLHFYRKSEFKKCIKSFKKVLPAFILTIAFYAFYTTMLPDTFSPGGLSKYNYLITQPMVMAHYIFTYFIPYNLSADTDWKVYTSIFDYRAITGIIIVLVLFYSALKASVHKNTRLYSFGVLWFFITLLPTSSFIPFAEVLNDHRSFIPYIGLTIAFVFGVKYLLDKHFLSLLKQRSAKTILTSLLVVFLGLNTYGVRERNKVWKNDLTLWKDVSVKSPKNGRGLMNYGLALMARGDYSNAEKQYLKALELSPNYANLYINLGILKNATGNKKEAENYFKKALKIDPSKHISWYYYGRFLVKQEQYEVAKIHLLEALKLSPSYAIAQTTLFEVYHKTNDWGNLKIYAEKILKKSPNNSIAIKYLDIAINKKSIFTTIEEDISKAPTPAKYLDLSLKYFQYHQFENTIKFAQEALKLKNNYPEAYNNIGIANFKLGAYDKAIKAYQKALEINPEYKLAKNNLTNVIAAKNKKSIKNDFPSNLITANDFLNFSLKCYKEGKYNTCIEAAKRSIEITPNANAYSNMCAAYNQLKEYDQAIKAGYNAIKLEPNHKLAKGNLNFSIQQIKTNN